VSSDLGKSECLFLVDQQRNVIIPGTGSCQTPCDPLVATACAPTGKCTPAPAKAGWIFPSCFPVSPTDKQDGEACSDKETCTTGLGCGQYGPRVCTRYCLVDADCSADRPLCHTSNLTLGSGESLGQCVAPCDDAHLSGEPQWTAGPVWTKEWFEPNCEDLCGSASYRCYRDNCPGGARYYECFTASRNALATAPSGVCRDAYVKATCVDDAMRTPSKHMLDGCLGLTQYDEQAHKQCVSGL
jgi:hypothetical protein